MTRCLHRHCKSVPIDNSPCSNPLSRLFKKKKAKDSTKNNQAHAVRGSSLDHTCQVYDFLGVARGVCSFFILGGALITWGVSMLRMLLGFLPAWRRLCLVCVCFPLLFQANDSGVVFQVGGGIVQGLPQHVINIASGGLCCRSRVSVGWISSRVPLALFWLLAGCGGSWVALLGRVALVNSSRVYRLVFCFLAFCPLWRGSV